MTPCPFEIVFNRQNGGIDSLTLAGDPAKMNWVEGFETWGVPAGFDFVSCREMRQDRIAFFLFSRD
jgi:hypothetical protein